MVKNSVALVFALSLAAGCKSRSATPPGYQGVVEYDERVVSFEVPGRILEVKVKEGDVVKDGDVLARLDDTLEKLAREARASEVKIAEADLKLLTAGARAEDIGALASRVKALKSTETLLDSNSKRAHGLFQAGTLPLADLEKIDADLIRTTNERRSLESPLAALIHGARPEEIDRAKAVVMLTSMALARERERGTLEQLIVSPVRNIELMLGKIIPYVAIGYVQMLLILGVGRVVFDVPVRGSLPLLLALSSMFIAANLAIGLFFSTLAKTQQQAMQMSFFFFLPNILLSGFMFPFEAMPRPAQALALVLPLTHFLRIVRGIVLKGSNFGDLATELVWLAGILGALVLFASVRFRKKLV